MDCSRSLIVSVIFGGCLSLGLRFVEAIRCARKVRRVRRAHRTVSYYKDQRCQARLQSRWELQRSACVLDVLSWLVILTCPRRLMSPLPAPDSGKSGQGPGLSTAWSPLCGQARKGVERDRGSCQGSAYHSSQHHRYEGLRHGERNVLFTNTPCFIAVAGIRRSG